MNYRLPGSNLIATPYVYTKLLFLVRVRYSRLPFLHPRRLPSKWINPNGAWQRVHSFWHLATFILRSIVHFLKVKQSLCQSADKDQPCSGPALDLGKRSGQRTSVGQNRSIEFSRSARTALSHARTASGHQCWFPSRRPAGGCGICLPGELYKTLLYVYTIGVRLVLGNFHLPIANQTINRPTVEQHSIGAPVRAGVETSPNHMQRLGFV